MPVTEDLRLLALFRAELLDTEAEAAFDALTKAAALVCGTQISLISLVAEKRQWFKSAVGLPQGGETPREHAFCAHAIADQNRLFEIPDALNDQRFADNPLVQGEPNIRFYAGVPVQSANGFALGTLCVIDNKPRQLSGVQRDGLCEIARGVEALIHARQQSQEAARRLARVYLESPGLLYLLDPTGAIIEVSELWLHRFGYQRSAVLGRNARDFMTKQARQDFLAVREKLWAAGGCRDFQTQFETADGQPVDVLMSAAIEKDESGQPLRVKCVLSDITEQLIGNRRLVASQVTPEPDKAAQ